MKYFVISMKSHENKGENFLLSCVSCEEFSSNFPFKQFRCFYAGISKKSKILYKNGEELFNKIRTLLAKYCNRIIYADVSILSRLKLKVFNWNFLWCLTVKQSTLIQQTLNVSVAGGLWIWLNKSKEIPDPIKSLTTILKEPKLQNFYKMWTNVI